MAHGLPPWHHSLPQQQGSLGFPSLLQLLLLASTLGEQGRAAGKVWRTQAVHAAEKGAMLLSSQEKMWVACTAGGHHMQVGGGVTSAAAWSWAACAALGRNRGGGELCPHSRESGYV